jgi:NlpC/P60 family putative phage cell wall peptidase
METQTITREMIVAEAMGWLGTPYQHDQNCKGAGVDCSTFLIGVWEACGYGEIEPVGHYSEDWNMHQNDPMYLNLLLKHSRFINPQKSPPLPGDLVIVKLARSRSQNHTAIIIDFPKIIHAVYMRGVVIDDVRVFACPFNILRWKGFTDG